MPPQNLGVARTLAPAFDSPDVGGCDSEQGASDVLHAQLL